jgi:hypothetical protein
MGHWFGFPYPEKARGSSIFGELAHSMSMKSYGLAFFLVYDRPLSAGDIPGKCEAQWVLSPLNSYSWRQRVAV